MTPITDYAYRAFASENPNIASLPDLSKVADRPPTVASSFSPLMVCQCIYEITGLAYCKLLDNQEQRKLL